MPAYHTLIIRQGDRWAAQYGDYNKDAVLQERRDSFKDISKSCWKIIKTESDDQKEIDRRIQQLNDSQQRAAAGFYDETYRA